MDEEVRSTMPLPRKRGPRGPGRRGRKSRRENSQDLQGNRAQSQEQNTHLGKENNRLEGVAGQGQGLQVEENEQQDSGKGIGINLESLAGRARLPRRKRLYKQLIKTWKETFSLLRSLSKTKGIGEDLDTGALERILRNLQRHEDSWPFVR